MSKEMRHLKLLKQIEKHLLSCDSSELMGYAKRKADLSIKLHDFSKKNDFSPVELIGCAIFVFANSCEESGLNHSDFKEIIDSFINSGKSLWIEFKEDEKS
ncbi:MAG TPA: hypothetical protein VMW10_09005 [Alphaproteobacteria bacterium]|nr:hypothetical protein [Alphaproteobacteria bacterium]